MLPFEVNMKIAVFSLIRNEIDIISDFMYQLTNLFDYIYIGDHESNDATKAVVKNLQKSHPNISIFTVKGKGYPQHKVTSYFINLIFEEKEPDWLFLLDADEFISIQNRVQLEQWLSDYSNIDLLKLSWLNAYPEDFSKWKSLAENRIRLCNKLSSFSKIIINTSLYRKFKPITVSRGNHDVDRIKNNVKEQYLTDPYILHLPFRSLSQLKRKLLVGCASYYGDLNTINTSDGFHWKDLMIKESIEGIDEDSISAIVNIYNEGEIKEDIRYNEGVLLFDYPILETKFSLDDASIAYQLYLDLENNLFHFSKKDVILIENDEGNVTLLSDKSETQLSLNPIREPVNTPFEFEENEFHEIVDTLFYIPKYVVYSAWTGHIPFMYHLLKMLKPNRYVELGVHLGGSFLTVCDAVQKYFLNCEAYGIDNWEGDIHAGIYEGDRIYRDLLNKIKEYPFARLLRYDFDEANNRFQDGSIDLLNIDGCHRYGDVFNDFKLWFPMLTSRGVILFHDISVYERNFGVWQLWNDIKGGFPHIEFHHSYGLGVLLVGQDIPNELLNFVSRFNSDNLFRSIYMKLCENLSPLVSVRRDYLEISDRINILTHFKDTEIDNLNNRIAEIYNSRTWKVGSFLNRIYRSVIRNR
jgi:hypothetical protein